MRADRALKKKERDWDKRARAIFWDNQRLVRNTELHNAEERGRKVGFIQGCMGMQKYITRKMIDKCYSLEEIQAITSLSSEEIDNLR